MIGPPMVPAWEIFPFVVVLLVLSAVVFYSFEAPMRQYLQSVANSNTNRAHALV